MLVFANSALTIHETKGIVNIIRCHTDPDKIPGEVEWSCAIELYENGTAEPKILHGRRGPTLAEIRVLSKYFKSIGYAVLWHRYKNGKKDKEVILNSNPAEVLPINLGEEG